MLTFTTNTTLASEVSKMRASHTFTVTHIDGYIDDGSLANMFGNKCDHLYNGVSYNTNGKIYIKTNIVL